MNKIEELDELVKKENKTSTEACLAWAYGESVKMSGKNKERFHVYVTNHLVFNDIIWEKELKDLPILLLTYDIKEIVISDKSTALMNTLIKFIENKWKIVDTIIYGYENPIFMSEDGEQKPLKGLLLKFE